MSRGERSKKKKVKIKTKWENSTDRHAYMVLNIKKTVIRVRQKLAAWIICNLLLKAENVPEIVFLANFLAEILKY